MKTVLLILLIAIAAFIAPFLVYALLLYIGAAFVDPDREYERGTKFYRFIVSGAVWISVHVMRIKPKLYGREKLPEGPYLLVGNHRSGFDPLATLYVIRDPKLVFIAKPSIKRVPGIGRIMHRSVFLFIDRDNPRNAIKTIDRAASLMKEGIASVGVYPEGTRSKDKELLPFHNGVFKAAQKAGVPVVIAAITGTENINKNFPFHKTRVGVTVTDCINADEVAEMRTTDISERVRASLEEALGHKEAENER